MNKPNAIETLFLMPPNIFFRQYPNILFRQYPGQRKFSLTVVLSGAELLFF